MILYWFQFKNAAKNHCLEVSSLNFGQNVNIYQCDFNSAEQHFSFQTNGQILLTSETCLDIDNLSEKKFAVKLVKCSTEDDRYRWELQENVIVL